MVGREHGFRTRQELGQARDASREWVEDKNVVLSTDLEYAPSEPVEVVVRKRGWRGVHEGGGTPLSRS